MQRLYFSLRNRVASIRRSDEGSQILEYVLIGTVVAVIIVGLFALINTGLTQKVNEIFSN